MNEPIVEVSTVSDDEVVVHVSDAYDHASEVAMPRVVRVAGLRPESSYEVEGASVRTLARPPGAHLSSFATVNDVHFGEVECGVLEGFETGPILSVGPGEVPYPQMMNRCAVEEISDLAPDAVLAKGDLTTIGTREEYQTFLDCYRAGFGDRLHFVRGNHDAMSGLDFGLDAPRELELDGVRLAILDTVIPGRSNGQVSSDQLEWLDELGARSDRPVLVFGHHHVWDPSSHNRPLEYFGVNPDDSERLVAVMARRAALAGYFAGHTHRNRVRRFVETGDLPWVEVACTKDYPGSWAEYRVFEGGVLQVHRRISRPAALRWSERCRALFGGLYPQYALGSVDDRCFTLWTSVP